MSVTGPDFWKVERGAVMVTAEGQSCIYCGNSVEDPAIVWSGMTEDIWLHPRCGADFLLRLARDVLEWQGRTGQRFGGTS